MYASIKTGINVGLGDLAMNTLFDLLNYSAEVDAAALARMDGKSVRKSAPMSLAEMTAKGKTRG
ncbi:MAG: hypothetical protein FWD58_02165 [Firmicutes bacterium]|nr:hypothetical protein [Bacillota bacterium]